MTGKPNFDPTFQNSEVDPLAEQSMDFDWADLRFATRAAKARCLKAIGMKALAFAWALNPDLIEGCPSLTKLAVAYSLHKVELSRFAAEVTRVFGVSNRFQNAHNWRKE